MWNPVRMKGFSGPAGPRSRDERSTMGTRKWISGAAPLFWLAGWLRDTEILINTGLITAHWHSVRFKSLSLGFTHTHTQTDRHTNTHTHTHRQTDRQTHLHTHTHTHTFTHTHTHTHYTRLFSWAVLGSCSPCFSPLRIDHRCVVFSTHAT